MNEKELAILRRAIQQFGNEAQMIVAIEELSEVTKEICKVFRGKGNKSAIAEELADAQIMLTQLVMIFDCGEETVDWITRKLSRLEDRIKGYNVAKTP